jgi:hypothetical protein
MLAEIRAHTSLGPELGVYRTISRLLRKARHAPLSDPVGSQRITSYLGRTRHRPVRPEYAVGRADRAQVNGALPGRRGRATGPLARAQGVAVRGLVGVAEVLATGTAAAASAVAVAVATGAFSGPAIRSAAVRPPAIRLTLTAQLLSTAAATVAKHPAVRPGPHQWFYTKFVALDYGQPTQSNKNWETFDGRQTAYFQNGQLIVHKTLRVFGGGPTPLDKYNANATPQTAYNALASLPSSPKALLAVIGTQIAQLGPSVASGSVVSLYAPKGRDELEFDYLAQLLWNAATGEPPAAEAAVFRALAAIPGVSSQQGITDIVGRPAIGLSDNGRKTQLLLDPQTYQVIGMRAASAGTDPVRTIAGKGRKVPWPPKGTIIESTAWAQVRMVSEPGRL